MQNVIHLFGDGHLNSAGASKSDRGLGGEDAFGDRSVHAGNNVGQFAPAPQFDADAAIARETAGASENEVSQAGETGHGFLTPSAGHSQTGDFRQAAGDKSGDGIVAESQPVAHASRDGDERQRRPWVPRDAGHTASRRVAAART